jgi:PEP-CTERM motif-containing protein
MKKLSSLLVLLTISMILFAGNATAIPLTKCGDVLSNTAGYEWNDSELWYVTDLTTALSGEGFFELRLEKAAYESDFGFYTVDENGNIDKTQTIFNYTAEPDNGVVATEQSVYFQNNSEGWEISLDSKGWNDFDSQFGFFFGVHTGGTSDAVADHYYYTGWDKNTVNEGEQHVAVEWDGINKVNIFLEDLVSNPDWDWMDMVVKGVDIAPAPVPEPATMLLLGTGLFGLAGVSRKKLFKR